MTLLFKKDQKTVVNTEGKDASTLVVISHDTPFYEVLPTWVDTPLYEVLPTWVKTTAGSSVTLICNSLNDTEWLGVNIENQDKTLEGNTITLRNIQIKHSGNYYCRNVNYNKEVHSQNSE